MWGNNFTRRKIRYTDISIPLIKRVYPDDIKKKTWGTTRKLSVRVRPHGTGTVTSSVCGIINDQHVPMHFLWVKWFVLNLNDKLGLHNEKWSIMFIFKSKEIFQLHNTERITRTRNTTRDTILSWRKEHLRK